MGKAPRSWERGSVSQCSLFDLAFSLLNSLLGGKKAAVADPKLPSWLFSQSWPWKLAVDIFIWPMVHLPSPL